MVFIFYRRGASMRHAIKRIDTSQKIHFHKETCQCFFIFLQDTLTRLYNYQFQLTPIPIFISVI